MENTNSNFDTGMSVEKDFVVLTANGVYSLLKATNLFKSAIDNCVLHNKTKILIDVNNISGNIPFFDRVQFAEFLADYRAKHALTTVDRIAVVGQEPIVHKDRFGETVAVNRGTNVRVFTEMKEASTWLTAD